LSDFLSIPDSVEVLSFWPHPEIRPHRALTFGSDSRLRHFSSRQIGGLLPSRSFMQVTSRSLKIFRTNMEFKSSA
jgi:hypothetical protein